MKSIVTWFLSCMSWYCIIVPLVYSEKEIIKDGPIEDWYRTTFIIEGRGAIWDKGPNSKTSPYYTTCGNGEKADFWLITKHINGNQIKVAEIIHVEVEAGLRLCEEAGTDKNVPCYSNYFEIYIYSGNYVNERGSNDVSGFVFLHNITNSSSPSENLHKSNQTSSFNPENYPEGATFGIRSTGACGTLFRMKMYYYFCDDTIDNGIKFEKTSSPVNGSKNVVGKCVSTGKIPNNDTSLIRQCFHNGTWSNETVDGNLACFCVDGHQVNQTDESCIFPSTTSPPTTETNPSTPASTTGSPKTLKPTNKSNKDDYLIYIIIGVVGVCSLIILIVLFIIYLRRRRNDNNNYKNGFINHGVELPRAGSRLYEDPSNYDDPEVAVSKFANELDPSSIFLVKLIGGGEFGDVYQGELIKDNQNIPIAVKTLKHDADVKSEKDFMFEASVMGQFDDPNVVRLEGVIMQSIPRMIVLEYMSNGSLDNYLKSNDNKLTDLQLIGMARGVAAGMKYLSEINFVHRDLAARNILLNDSLLCKIADFGLSRELETTDTSRGEYSTQGGKIPVRWTAPEAIKYRKFSTASDVWSFGILLWEIMSYAQRPYWDWDNFKVIEEIDNGYRLPPPLNCPKKVHELMLRCWKEERGDRPSFAEITSVITKWIRSPETFEDHEIDFSDTVIGEWLTSIKMDSYESNFLAAGYRRKSAIINLTDEDLKTIGIRLIGHRNKIMKGINSLKYSSDIRKGKRSVRV